MDEELRKKELKEIKQANKRDYLYNAYIDSKEERMRGCNEEYEDSYTRAWVYIEDSVGGDKDCIRDYVDSLEYMSCH